MENMLDSTHGVSILLLMNSPRTSRPARKPAPTFAPAAWQWDASSLTGGAATGQIQYWTAGGSCSLVSLDAARKMVAAREAFAGSASHVCQIHNRIDIANASYL